MIIPTIKTVLSSILLNIVSLIFAYHIWYSLSNWQTITTCLPVPIYCYNTNAHESVSGASHHLVRLQTKRSALIDNFSKAAINIDRNTLSEGNNCIDLTASHLLLPESFELVSYDEPNLLLQILKKEHA